MLRSTGVWKGQSTKTTFKLIGLLHTVLCYGKCLLPHRPSRPARASHRMERHLGNNIPHRWQHRADSAASRARRLDRPTSENRADQKQRTREKPTRYWKKERIWVLTFAGKEVRFSSPQVRYIYRNRLHVFLRNKAGNKE